MAKDYESQWAMADILGGLDAFFGFGLSMHKKIETRFSTRMAQFRPTPNGQTSQELLIATHVKDGVSRDCILVVCLACLPHANDFYSPARTCKRPRKTSESFRKNTIHSTPRIMRSHGQSALDPGTDAAAEMF